MGELAHLEFRGVELHQFGLGHLREALKPGLAGREWIGAGIAGHSLTYKTSGNAVIADFTASLGRFK